MRNLRSAFFCAGTNFLKWRKNPVIILMSLFWLLFLVSYFIDIPGICLKRGFTVTPWIMPFTLAFPLDTFLFCIVIIILFAQAPFHDSIVPFTMVRTGKMAWFLGQIFYIIGASVVFTVFTLVCTILITLPCMEPCFDWGPKNNKMIIDVALNSNAVAEKIMNPYSVPEALFHTIRLQVLTTMLIGCMILFFNMIRQGLGVLVTSTVACWSFFAMHLHNGSYIYTTAIYKTAVLQWASLFHLYPIIERDGVPIGDAVNIMTGLILFFIIGSIILFYKRDTQFSRNRF